MPPKPISTAGTKTNRRSSSKTRLSRGNLPKARFDAENDEIEDEEDHGDGQVQEDENQEADESIQLLLQALKGRNAAKANHGKALQAKCMSLCDGARFQVGALKSEFDANIQDARAEIARLREEEVTSDITSAARLFGNRSKSIYKLLEIFETDVGELGSEGAEKVEIISSDLASFPIKYKKIRGRAIRDAQAIVGASYEEQKLATDAQAYIKHFEAIVLL